MSIKMKRKILYISIFILVALGTFFYFYKNSAPEPVSARPRCPESFPENDIGTAEYRNALIDWTSKFFEANPEATMLEWSEAKSQLWKDNNCVIALSRSKLSGKVADLKPWEKVDYALQNAIQSAIDVPH